jgi:hypothetical protein
MTSSNATALKAVRGVQPNITASLADNPPGSISRDLKERIDQQRDAVFRVQAIVRVVADLLNEKTDDGDKKCPFLSMLFSLDVASDMLDVMAEKLDVSLANVIEDGRT